MRLDQLDVFTVTVGDLKFAVRMNDDEYLALLRSNPQPGPEATAEENEQWAEANVQEQRATIRKHVIGVEGLTDVDEEGHEHPIAWQVEFAGRIGPGIVLNLWRGICQPGLNRQAGDPLA